MNNVYGRAGPNSIWSTTALGDVYVFDPAIAEVRYKIYLQISICIKYEGSPFVILILSCLGMSII